LLFRIAKNYYINGYSQNEIAKMEKISRPQVSRLLKRARDAAIVKIDVALPHIPGVKELEDGLKKALKLENVVISLSSYDKKENDAGLYSVSVDYICEILRQYRNVGLGWGKTMYNISLQLTHQQKNTNLTFYPIVGNSGVDNPYLQINNIVDRFAERFQANAQYNNELSISPKESINPLSEQRLLNLQKCWENLDAAVIGAGANSMSSDHTFLDEWSSEIKNKGFQDLYIGDIIGEFICQDESVLQYPVDYQFVSIGIEGLKRVKNVICIAHGMSKVDIIIYASRHKIVKTLVTDQSTAVAILNQIK